MKSLNFFFVFAFHFHHERIKVIFCVYENTEHFIQ